MPTDSWTSQAETILVIPKHHAGTAFVAPIKKTKMGSVASFAISLLKSAAETHTARTNASKDLDHLILKEQEKRKHLLSMVDGDMEKVDAALHEIGYTASWDAMYYQASSHGMVLASVGLFIKPGDVIENLGATSNGQNRLFKISRHEELVEIEVAPDGHNEYLLRSTMTPSSLAAIV